MTGCGYTPDQIDAMEFSAVLDLFDYWQEWPPLHEMVKAYLGIKPKKRLTIEGIRAMKPPPGCLSIDELRKFVAAHPVSTLRH